MLRNEREGKAKLFSEAIQLAWPTRLISHSVHSNLYNCVVVVGGGGGGGDK